jgi:VWFA-related protein
MRTVRLCIALAMLVPAASLVAQTSVFHAGTWLVVLRATVTNGSGHVVTGLDQKAFTVFENGKRQRISLFRNDDVPVSIGVLIDNSGSMRDLRGAVEAAALEFAGASNPDDEMFVVNFADHARVDVPMTSDLTALQTGIRRLDSIGGTALRDAIEMGETYLRSHARHDRHVLVVISDGNDNASVTTLDAIRRQAEQSDTAIDAIGLFHAQDVHHAADGRRELTELTTRTGGVALFPADVSEIHAAAVDLAHQIRSQYTIAYAPANQQLDGAYRAIRLAVAGPQAYTVRTRPGYRATSDAIGSDK